MFKILKKNCDLPPREVVQAVLTDIDLHTAGGTMSDDQSLIVLKVS